MWNSFLLALCFAKIEMMKLVIISKNMAYKKFLSPFFTFTNV